MTHEEILAFESKLDARGYKKIKSAKAEFDDDYEWYKTFRDDERELEYQIFFCFWNFEKYRDTAGWSVSVVIMPESCRNDVGRRDLHLSVSWSTDINKVENCASNFYKFITKFE